MFLTVGLFVILVPVTYIATRIGRSDTPGRHRRMKGASMGTWASSSPSARCR